MTQILPCLLTLRSTRLATSSCVCDKLSVLQGAVREKNKPITPMIKASLQAVHNCVGPYSVCVCVCVSVCVTAVQGLRFSCYSWAPEPRHPVHVTDVYATESRTPLVRELSADRFSVGLLLRCSPPSRVRAGEWAKVCGGQAPLWSAASAEKQRIFFLFRLQPTRHHYSLTHSTAHMNSCQSTKWHQTH